MLCIFIKKHFSKDVIRFLIAFFVAWVISILLNDIPPVVNLLKQTGVQTLFQNILVKATEISLNVIGFETYREYEFLQIIGTPGVLIEYECLGIRHITIFFSFILFHIGPFISKVKYAIVGSIILELSNVVRIAIICLGQYYSEISSTLVHDIATPIFMYPTILLLWFIWISKLEKEKNTISN